MFVVAHVVSYYPFSRLGDSKKCSAFGECLEAQNGDRDLVGRRREIGHEGGREGSAARRDQRIGEAPVVGRRVSRVTQRVGKSESRRAVSGAEGVRFENKGKKAASGGLVRHVTAPSARCPSPARKGFRVTEHPRAVQ